MALLRRGDLSVTEVCFAVGCSSLGTFSTRFTELVGMPPSAYRRRAARATAGMPPCVAKQVTRPIRNREAHGAEPRTSVTAMNITIHASLLPAHTIRTPRSPSTATPSASRSATTSNTAACTGSPSAPPTSPTRRSCSTRRPPRPGITDDERRTIAEMMAKGTYASINLATDDLDGTFARLQAGDAEVVQEPTEQPYGIRDCAFRDPAGNLIRINQPR